ncbi:MAG: deoxyribonucleotide triphosphate pyrophosphatase [Trichormus sp. ATA11-4-KO1]|jgi:hypothetical protein|nr:deoxyribonucleotide triphosphate pyrophosphatase [Trichormus sp. ATA11-4-KO1]
MKHLAIATLAVIFGSFPFTGLTSISKVIAQETEMQSPTEAPPDTGVNQKIDIQVDNENEIEIEVESQQNPLPQPASETQNNSDMPDMSD